MNQMDNSSSRKQTLYNDLDKFQHCSNKSSSIFFAWHGSFHAFENFQDRS